jgi:hypothetical protein
MFILAVLISAFQGHTQTIVQGIIKEERGISLPGAHIYFDQTQTGTISDLDGKFEITTTLSGTQILKVEYIGYSTHEQRVSLNNTKIVVQVILQSVSNQFETVTIIAGAFEASDKKKSVALKPLDIVTTAGALGDISGALQTLPGTTTVGESGRLFVRGGDDTETQTFIDGMLVPVPYTSGAPNLSVRGRFNPFIFSGTIFSVGGYSAEYGQALSSVLQLNTKDLPSENKIDLSLMTVGVSASTTQLWNDGAISASFDYNDLRPYMEIVSQNADWITPPKFLGGEVNIRQKTSEHGMLKLYGKLGRSSLKLNSIDLDARQGYTPFELQNDNVYLNSNWNNILSDKWSLMSGASYTKNTDNNRIADFNAVQDLEAGHVKIVVKNFSIDGLTVKFGGETFIQNISETFVLDTINLSNHLRENRLSGFGEAQIDLSNKLALRFGGRLEQSDHMSEITFAPRFSTAYKLDGNRQVSFAYGQFYQQAPNNILLRTEAIREQQANHYILNYQVSKNNRLLRVETYYKDYKHLITYDTSLSKIGNKGNGYAYGLDVFYKDLKSIKNAQFWISYSYLNTKRKYKDYPEPAIPTFASTHSISVVYKHWMSSWKSLISCSAAYSTPRVYNDPNQAAFNDSQTTPFRSLNLSWSYLPRPHIIFYGAVTNVLGFNNQFGSQFSSQADINGIYAKADILPSAKRFIFVGCFLTFTKKGQANQLDTLN